MLLNRHCLQSSNQSNPSLPTFPHFLCLKISCQYISPSNVTSIKYESNLKDPPGTGTECERHWSFSTVISGGPQNFLYTPCPGQCYRSHIFPMYFRICINHAFTTDYIRQVFFSLIQIQFPRIQASWSGPSDQDLLKQSTFPLSSPFKFQCLAKRSSLQIQD